MFKPTRPMQRAKAILHRNLEPESVLSLTADHPELPVFIRPTPLRRIREWVGECGDEFWEWFVTPPECDGNKLHTVERAWEVLQEIMNLEIKDAFGIINVDVLKAKQKAAEVLLAKQTPMIAIQNNNNSDSPKLPAGLARKTQHELEELVRSKTRYIPSGSKPQYLEGETDD